MLKHILTLILLTISLTTQAATLVCDWMPWSPDGSDVNKADVVQYSSDGGQTWTDFNIETADEQTTFRIHEPFDTTSVIDWTVRAYNTQWGRESAHVPFTWGGEGPIVAPAGFQIVP